MLKGGALLWSLVVGPLSCKRAAIVDACLEDPDLCPACASDDDCAFGGNACTETVYCAHVDAEIAVVMIGCSPAMEYAWPSDEDCVCSASVCQSAD